VAEQTKRHTIIATMLGIPHLVVCINKMDLVHYSRTNFEQIVADYKAILKDASPATMAFIPVSALIGDNVVERSEKMPWYKGDPLLHYLEKVEVQESINLEYARFPVQYVIRPQTDELPDYRGYAGKIMSGIYRKGDSITILPAGTTSTIKAIEIANREVEEAFAPQSVVLRLADELDVGRGDMIVKADDMPELSQEFEAILCWLDTKPLKPGATYLLQLNSTTVKALVSKITYRLDVETMQQEPDPEQIRLNDIAKVTIRTAVSLPHDNYAKLRTNGGAILIDENSCATVAACMIR
jgi:sulfate adenylyltransferase subunit 1